MDDMYSGESFNCEGCIYNDGWRTVQKLKSGYLAIRTAPVCDYSNEVIHDGPKNGQMVQITGDSVPGTDAEGAPCTYIWVYSPDHDVSGYVNSCFIG